jgi:hypothetical protein
LPKTTSKKWTFAEHHSVLLNAEIAAHDYAHMGYYFRIIRNYTDNVWDIFLRPGRTQLPACCRPKKRTYVTEATPDPTWVPRANSVLSTMPTPAEAIVARSTPLGAPDA